MLKKSLKQCLRTQQSVLEYMAQGRELSDCLFLVFKSLEDAVRPYAAKAFLLLRERKGTYSLISQAERHGASNPQPDFQVSCDLLTREFNGQAEHAGLAKLTAKERAIPDLTHHKLPISSSLQQRLIQQGWRSLWAEPVYSSADVCLGWLVFQTREVYEPDSNHRDLMAAYIGLVRSILEKYQKDCEVRLLNRQLRNSLDRLQVYCQVMPDLGMVLSEQGDYVDVYGSHEVVGYDDAEQLIGKNIRDCLDSGVARDILHAAELALKTGDPQVFEYELMINGSRVIFESRVAPIENYLPSSPDKRHVVWVARDITQRRLSEKRIEHMAYYDPLTQLPNRRLLMDRLQHTIDQVSRHQTMGAVIFVDLDGFKRVNDDFGHDYGDALLTEIAKRLKNGLRDSDTIARFGGDEFVVVVERMDDNLESMYHEAMNVSRRILANLKPGITVFDQSFLMNASVGISLIYGTHLSAEGVLREADKAMYQAKHTGKTGQICLYKAS